MTREDTEKMIDGHVEALCEHFEAVQIMVTRQTDEKQTEFFSRGSGNFYAREGIARTWLEMGRADLYKQEPPTDDSEEWKRV